MKPVQMPVWKKTGTNTPMGKSPSVPGATFKGTSGTTKWNPPTPAGMPKNQ